MTRNEYISTLDSALGNISAAEKQEILYDYQEHFAIGAQNGRTEEQISSELGDPRFIARQYRAERIVKRAEENKTGSNIIRAVFAALSLGFVNLIFILPLFLALVGVLIGLYGAAIGFTLGGIGVFLGLLLQPVFPEYINIPAINQGIVVFTGIACTAFGLLFCIADAYITRFFYQVTIKYIKANIRIISK